MINWSNAIQERLDLFGYKLEEEKVSKEMLKFHIPPSFYFAIIACSISLIDWFFYSFIFGVIFSVKKVSKLFTFSRNISCTFGLGVLKAPWKSTNTSRGLKTTFCCSLGPWFNFAWGDKWDYIIQYTITLHNAQQYKDTTVYWNEKFHPW